MSAVLPVLDEESHTYTLAGRKVPGVTSILQPLSGLQFVDRDVLDAAAAFGRAVHRACELDDLGQLDEEELDPALGPYLAGWRRFSADHDVRWHLIEHLVFNEQQGYAGTLDRFGIVRGDEAVVDIKSSVALSPTVGPQLAAYQRAIPGATLITKRIGVLLKPDGTYQAKTYTSPGDWPLFVSLLTLNRWCAEHGVTPYFPKEKTHA